MLLADPECVAIVEEMSKMTRKTGIKFRLVTHVARVDQLGGSPVLRSMVVAGNVFIFRTGAQSDAGFATQGAMRVEANQIPKEFPNGEPTFGLGYTMGAISRPVTMRADYVEDPFDYIDEEKDPVWALDGASLQDVYDIYRMRWHDDFGAGDILQGEVVDEHDAPVEPPAPVGPEATPDADSYGRDYTCQRAIVDYLRSNAATKNRPVSVIALRTHLLEHPKAWGNRNVNAAIKEAVENRRSPVDSDDDRKTIYLKETARTGT